MQSSLFFFHTLGNLWFFLHSGSWFMWPIVLCSIIALTVIVYKCFSLSRNRLIPEALARKVEQIETYLESGHMEELEEAFNQGESALARLCAVAMHHAGRTQGEVQQAVEASAQEEVVGMESGMPALEVIITIAPLLGLLGTVSGLVLVFANVGNGADAGRVGQGIAMALNTTVAGLVVAVPTVIAHSHFDRKIATMSARLEVLLGKVTSACHQHAFFR